MIEEAFDSATRKVRAHAQAFAEAFPNKINPPNENGSTDIFTTELILRSNRQIRMVRLNHVNERISRRTNMTVIGILWIQGG